MTMYTIAEHVKFLPFLIQLTNETLVETIEELSTLVQETEERPVEQSTENLESIANVLGNVANFVNESDIEINKTASNQFHIM